MFHEDCFVSFRRPCARDLILITVRARSNLPLVEQAQMLFADSSSANASAKRGLSATKQNVQMEVKQQDTVCHLLTNPKKCGLSAMNRVLRQSEVRCSQKLWLSFISRQK
ncbi:unnamed protein product [Ixodes pacificus]